MQTFKVCGLYALMHSCADIYFAANTIKLNSSLILDLLMKTQMHKQYNHILCPTQANTHSSSKVLALYCPAGSLTIATQLAATPTDLQTKIHIVNN